MTKTMHGKIHGRTIELDEDLGIADGQEVVIRIVVIPRTQRKTGDGFLRTEGALSHDDEWDTVMEEIRQARKQERRAPIPDLGQP